jgi:hypothetical protein
MIAVKRIAINPSFLRRQKIFQKKVKKSLDRIFGCMYLCARFGDEGEERGDRWGDELGWLLKKKEKKLQKDLVV